MLMLGSLAATSVAAAAAAYQDPKGAYGFTMPDGWVEGEPFRLTTEALHASGGGEVAVRFLRNSLVVLGVGAGGEGTQLLFATHWSY